MEDEVETRSIFWSRKIVKANNQAQHGLFQLMEQAHELGDNASSETLSQMSRQLKKIVDRLQEKGKQV